MTLEQQIQSLRTQVEELREKMERLDTKGTAEKSVRELIIQELREKLDETKEADARIMIATACRSGNGRASSINVYSGFESWISVPDSYIAKMFQPLTDPGCLAILKAFLADFNFQESKTREELQEISGVSGEDLDKLLMMLTELRYIKWETKQHVIEGQINTQDRFYLGERDLLLILLHYADRQRKYEEESRQRR